jgi:hypothetical protein
MRVATYVDRVIKKQTLSLSADIFIGHRTGREGFLDIKYARKDLAYKFENTTGTADYFYLNQQGELLNQKDIPYFEFDLEKYEQEISSLSQYIKGLSTDNSLIENQNIVNNYYLHLQEKYNANSFSMENKRKNTEPLSYTTLLFIISTLQQLEELRESNDYR